MGNDEKSNVPAQMQQLVGALDILEVLGDEMEQWLEEAQDESKRECLENVLGHINAITSNYRQRLSAIREAPGN